MIDPMERATEPPAAVVVMGVSGCGKTAIGRRLAAALGWTCRDGDDFHPPANVTKMTGGVPLTDADREPWLATLAALLETAVVAATSAIHSCDWTTNLKGASE